MTRHPIVLLAAAAAFVAVGAVGGWYWANRSIAHEPAVSVAHANGNATKERKVLYWHDPMVPGQKFDKPGKSPFMDMELVPVYADEEATAGVKVDSRLAQNLGVRTAVAEKGRLDRAVDVVGTIAFDERAVELVQARTAAYVQKLYVRAPLDAVTKGQPLVELFVPEWAGAQQEYLALKASETPGAHELAAAARNRLLLLNMTEPQIEAVDRAGKPVTHVTLVSPVAGVVGELGAREGMNVMPGATLFRLNGLATVWVNLDIPEALAGAVVPGAAIRASVPAYPGETFAGKVAAVLPDVNAMTRTLRARVELANPAAKLKPGMFATVSIVPARSREAVLVPSESVIVTGERAVVIVDRGDGRFEPVTVRIGRDAGGRTEIIEGIDAGTKVVASGQFLIDSEASLRGVEARMSAAAEPKPETRRTQRKTEDTEKGEGGVHHAEGRVEMVGRGTLTISHGPVPELKWPAMTMEFAAPKELPAGLKAGDRIAFDFVAAPDGGYSVTRVQRSGGAPS